MTILTLKGFFPCYHGDVIQLINSRYCVIILCVLALCHVILVSLYFRSPIHCICPSNIMSQQCDAIASYCLTSSLSDSHVTTFTAPSIGESEPAEDGLRVEIGAFYQFACLVLLLQASLFYVPYVMARELYRSCGIQPDELALSALEAKRSRDAEDRQAAVRDLATHINVYCARKLRRKRATYVTFRWFYSARLSSVQMLTRCWYLTNVIGQFYLVDALLGVSFHSLGWSVIGRGSSPLVELPPLYDFLVKQLQYMGAIREDLPAHIHSGLKSNSSSEVEAALANLSVNAKLFEPHLNEFQADFGRLDQPPVFPLEVLCRFSTPLNGVLLKFTAHCVLPLNRLNEIVYEYLWFLLAGVTLVSVLSLFKSASRLCLFPCQRAAIRHRLQDLGLVEDIELDDFLNKVDLFERSFLGVDGTLLLDYVKAGSGDVISDGTLAELWQMFVENADEYESLVQPCTVKESIIEDVIQVPSRRYGNPDEGRPLRSIFDPMQPPEIPKSLNESESVATFSKETELTKPFEFGAPPDYLATPRTDFGKLGTDDDFMV